MAISLNIAIGIIRNQQGLVFITQRLPGSHLAGYWEFPGGKVEQDETPQEALYRELLEETGIQVEQAELMKVLEDHTKASHLTLYFYLVTQWKGEPFGKEGQPMRWVAQELLDANVFPPANAEIIQLLQATDKG